MALVCVNKGLVKVFSTVLPARYPNLMSANEIKLPLEFRAGMMSYISSSCLLLSNSNSITLISQLTFDQHFVGRTIEHFTVLTFLGQVKCSTFAN